MSPSPSPVGTPVVPNQPAPAATAATNEREENRNDTGLVNPLRGPKENKRQRRRRLAKERNEILAKEKKTAKKQKEDKKTSVSANTKAARKAIEEELRKSESISMDEFPHGYPIQAAFQSSEPSFSIYRAFSYLHSRVILQLQDELRALEDALVELDEDDYWSGRGARLTSRDFDMEEARKAFEQKAPKKASTHGSESASTTQEDNRVAVPVSERAALLDQIRIKLLEYDEILVKGREMAEFQRPSDPDWLTFRIWFWNTKPLSYEREEEFIRRKGDLITLRPRAEWGMFDDWVKSRVSNMPKLFENLFREDEPKGDTRDKSASYYSVTRIEKFTTLIIAFVIILLLAVPVFVMYRVSWNGGRGMTLLNVGLLIVFSLFFSASMSLLTRARRAELFAASAAYSAVLIVFIGNFAGQDGGSGS